MSMDFYFSGQDSLSLQEMIDFDKREYDDYNSIDFELGASVPPLELDENSVNGLFSTSHSSNGLHMWLNGHTTTNSSPLSNSNYHLDFIDGDAEAAMMVDPHNVIPIDFIKTEPKSEPEIDVKLKLEPELSDLIKMEPEMDDMEDERDLDQEEESPISAPQLLTKSSSSIINKCKLKAKANILRDNLIIPTSLVSSLSSVNRLKNGIESSKSSVQSMPKTLATIRIGRADEANLLSHSTSSVKSVPVTIVTTTPNSLNQIKIVEGSVKTLTPVAVQTKKMISVNKKCNFTNYNSVINDDSYGIHSYPKPAYSYSCLIAMALKNSKSGSLPVSEIYNFMCNHFPYFKTAPSGWKNSVRHNLSLNQCFEKIEKPMTNSGASRKGCLWAMNPDKIKKMDAEVQKWSKKDPMAIKKAMVYPENLEALERGELKLSSYSDERDVGEEESEEYEEDTAEEDEEHEAEEDVDVDVDVPAPDAYLYKGSGAHLEMDERDMEVMGDEEEEEIYLTTGNGRVILNYNSDSEIE